MQLTYNTAVFCIWYPGICVCASHEAPGRRGRRRPAAALSPRLSHHRPALLDHARAAREPRVSRGTQGRWCDGWDRSSWLSSSCCVPPLTVSRSRPPPPVRHLAGAHGRPSSARSMRRWCTRRSTRCSALAWRRAATNTSCALTAALPGRRCSLSSTDASESGACWLSRHARPRPPGRLPA